MIVLILLCYTTFMFWLVIRLKSINEAPQTYNKIPGFEEYKKSEWYWPPKKDYGKLDPPDGSAIIIAFPFILFGAFFIISLSISAYWTRLELPRDKTTIRFFGSLGGYFAAALSLMAYSSVLAEYVSMFSKNPIAICHNLHQIFHKNDRSVAWRKMTIIVLVATIIVCPLHILALANVGYADNEKIIYCHYGSRKEFTLHYDELDRVEMVCDEKGREIHCYLVGINGESYDIHGLGDVLSYDRDVESLVLSYIPADIVYNTDCR